MIRLIKLWILVSAACVAGGWLLSALHELNTFGYAVFFAVVGLGFAIWARRHGDTAGWRWSAQGWTRGLRRRFRRLLPRIYLLGAIIAIVGGAIYAPRNYDALAYRVPRVLHWWSASSWHWIQTPDDRMNLSGTGFEWMMMALFAFSHSDRLFFLINAAGYLLMPGLVFGAFTRLGVPRRAAWYWMWLLPMGSCYLMQAGSICNDSFAVTYVLAATWFGLRAARNGQVSDLWMAVLAAAMLTGVKGSNLPLLLPVGWALWPAWKLVRLRPVSSTMVLLLAVLVSCAPTVGLNEFYTGHWTGDPYNVDKLQIRKPWAGITGNFLQLAVQSLEPPIFSMAAPAQVWVWEHLPRDSRSLLQQGFPLFDLGFRELAQEEWSGLGLGVTLIAVLSLFGATGKGRSRPLTAWPPASRRGLIIGLLAWLSLLVFSIKLGSNQTGRLLAPYYPLLLLPILVLPGQGRWVRQRWRQVLAACVGGMAVVALVLGPAHPLWPAQSILAWISEKRPSHTLLRRARVVYEVYDHRNDVFAELRARIPDSVSTIGVIDGWVDMESSLWRPFGRRRVVDLVDLKLDQPPGVEWVVVRNDIVAGKFGTFGLWARGTGGTLVCSEVITNVAHGGEERWSLLHFERKPH